MEQEVRRPFQGVVNILRFNWHFYVIVVMLIMLLIFIGHILPVAASPFIIAVVSLLCLSTGISLVVSYYIYDYSQLYRLTWLSDISFTQGAHIVNVHAGFDETSLLLARRFSGARLQVFDFYDPALHTEVSIRRARHRYPPYPGTENITTAGRFLESCSADYIFAILAAHEIRDTKERVVFFRQLKAGLRKGGNVVVVEHLRDLPNFIAYNIGFFHFLSAKEWMHTFNEAGFDLLREIKVTSFISVFILQHAATPS